MAMTGKRFACLILVVVLAAALGCANGRPKPLACAIAGQVAGATGGIVGGDSDGQRIAFGVGGFIVGSVAGYYLCKLAQKKEEPKRKARPEPAPPAPPPAPEPEQVQERIVLRGVNFDFDKSEIRPDAAVILDEVVSILSGKPGVKVRIEGHTDSTGPDEYNQGLSERRAASVQSFLVGKGIEASRLTSVGHGESKPIATNDTREGRALNRRVELQVLE
jgi:OOP family OmpA-OmpF porin